VPGHGRKQEPRTDQSFATGPERVYSPRIDANGWGRARGCPGIGSTDIVLVQVKTRDFPGAVEMEILRNFRCPPNCRRLIHRWRDRQRVPDVREL
jgi:hypothetical protein